MSNGLFVVLEGVDGAGKTEMAKLLANHLEMSGYEVVRVREPGGADVSEEIRSLLQRYDLDPTTKLCLFYAARNELLKTVILPALQRGAVVISDRFSDSSYVYQVALGEVSEYLFDELEASIVGDGEIIDLKILLDIDFKSYRQRKTNLDRLDLKTVEEFDFARGTYRGLARRSPDWWLMVDASQSKADVFADLSTVVEDRLRETTHAGRI